MNHKILNLWFTCEYSESERESCHQPW